jgi:hypothetical protein
MNIIVIRALSICKLLYIVKLLRSYAQFMSQIAPLTCATGVLTLRLYSGCVSSAWLMYRMSEYENGGVVDRPWVEKHVSRESSCRAWYDYECKCDKSRLECSKYIGAHFSTLLMHVRVTYVRRLSPSGPLQDGVKQRRRKNWELENFGANSNQLAVARNASKHQTGVKSGSQKTHGWLWPTFNFIRRAHPKQV